MLVFHLVLAPPPGMRVLLCSVLFEFVFVFLFAFVFPLRVLCLACAVLLEEEELLRTAISLSLSVCLSALADNVLDTSRCVYLYVYVYGNGNGNENENESASACVCTHTYTTTIRMMIMIMRVIMIESENENEKTDGPTHTMHAYCIVWKEDTHTHRRSVKKKNMNQDGTQKRIRVSRHYLRETYYLLINKKYKYKYKARRRTGHVSVLYLTELRRKLPQ